MFGRDIAKVLGGYFLFADPADVIILRYNSIHKMFVMMYIVLAIPPRKMWYTG